MPAGLKIGEPRSVQYTKWKGVNVTDARTALGDDEFSWLENAMTIGNGRRVHLRAEELPPRKIIERLSRHVCAVIDGVTRDPHDPTRAGTRGVYGYFTRD